MHKLLLLFILATAPLFSWATATSLFSELKESVFQIRVIDIASSDKFSIGSGFLISKQGHIATNFHVVSSYVHEPEKYRLEFVRLINDPHNSQEKAKEQILPTELLTFDVIHDLAILTIPSFESEVFSSRFLPLSKKKLNKGDRIYSMGNPHDLGMTIIEGNYNGLLQNSRYQKILFSGSLNPGMSGGPSINEEGEVIGINVSTQGDEISYLVPVSYLQSLKDSTNTNSTDTSNTDGLSDPREAVLSYKQRINQSLFQDQQAFYGNILSQASSNETLGQIEALGEVTVASNLSDSLKCWGHTTDSKEDEENDTHYRGVHQHCVTEDVIYIDSDISLGQFYYDYEWITSQTLNPFQFYTVISERFEHGRLGNTYQEKYVTEFTCVDDMISLTEHSWKVSSCFRAYKDYPNLYDSQLIIASTDENQKALIAKIGAAGISKDNAIQLFQRFMESISWNK